MAGQVAHDEVAVRGRERRQDTDFALGFADAIPRNPHGVRRPNVGVAIVRCEFFGRNHVPPIRRRLFGTVERIVVAINYELAAGLYRLVSLVVKVKSSAKSPSRWLARRLR